MAVPWILHHRKWGKLLLKLKELSKARSKVEHRICCSRKDTKVLPAIRLPIPQKGEIASTSISHHYLWQLSGTPVHKISLVSWDDDITSQGSTGMTVVDLGIVRNSMVYHSPMSLSPTPTGYQAQPGHPNQARCRAQMFLKLLLVPSWILWGLIFVTKGIILREAQIFSNNSRPSPDSSQTVFPWSVVPWGLGDVGIHSCHWTRFSGGAAQKHSK